MENQVIYEVNLTINNEIFQDYIGLILIYSFEKKIKFFLL